MPNKDFNIKIYNHKSTEKIQKTVFMLVHSMKHKKANISHKILNSNKKSDKNKLLDIMTATAPLMSKDITSH